VSYFLCLNNSNRFPAPARRRRHRRRCCHSAIIAVKPRQVTLSGADCGGNKFAKIIAGGVFNPAPPLQRCLREGDAPHRIKAIASARFGRTVSIIRGKRDSKDRGKERADDRIRLDRRMSRGHRNPTYVVVIKRSDSVPIDAQRCFRFPFAAASSSSACVFNLGLEATRTARSSRKTSFHSAPGTRMEYARSRDAETKPAAACVYVNACALLFPKQREAIERTSLMERARGIGRGEREREGGQRKKEKRTTAWSRVFGAESASRVSRETNSRRGAQGMKRRGRKMCAGGWGEEGAFLTVQRTNERVAAKRNERGRSLYIYIGIRRRLLY